MGVTVRPTPSGASLSGSEDALRGDGPRLVGNFLQMVELHYRDGWPVSRYAAALGVTEDRLHAHCKREKARSPRAIVHERPTHGARIEFRLGLAIAGGAAKTSSLALVNRILTGSGTPPCDEYEKTLIFQGNSPMPARRAAVREQLLSEMSRI